MTAAPRFSIILPTYNRRDVIMRAVDSVLAQSFGDFELVVIDDGSTDGTRDRLAGLDPRIQVIAQENAGVGAARNVGLAAARGALVAFLDSDDEWPPFHLELASAFFDAFPGEAICAAEMWEDFGVGEHVKHFRVELGDWYPATARVIGSRRFEGTPPGGDPYRWIFEHAEPLGPWADAALAGTPHRGAMHYRGNIFDAWRWGWLMALTPTVFSRAAVDDIGPFDLRYRVGNDFIYMATLCRRHTTNMLALPGCIKHEYGGGRRPLAEDHLVTGSTAVEFHLDVLRQIEALYCADGATADPELEALRGFRQFLAGRAALLKGQHDVASKYLELASHTYPPARSSPLLWLTRVVPHGPSSSALLRTAIVVERLPGRARRALHRLVAPLVRS